MEITKGNIFITSCQTIVSTINCFGIMRAGFAYECRLRYPQMYLNYVELCEKELIDIGSIWLHKTEDKWILNFPTKYHWKYPTKPEYLEKGLQKFLDTYKELGITSIAFPLLGTRNGRLPKDTSIKIMAQFLDKCDIPVEVYEYDPLAFDELFLKFKSILNEFSEEELVKKAGLNPEFVNKLKTTLENDRIRSLSQCLDIKGIDNISLEKSYNFVMSFK